MKKERIKAGWATWNVAKAAAQNREGWADNMMAVCAFWRGEP